MKIIYILSVFIFSFAVNIAIAKNLKAADKQKNTGEIAVNQPPIPFDINQETIPQGYKGTDIVALYSLLGKNAPLEKNEFETTAEYEKRVASATPGDVYACRIEEKSAYRGLKIKPYNADTQEYQITVETEYLSEHNFKDHRASLIVKTLDERSESYVGSNAFGATRKVTRFTATQYGIALVNQKEFGYSQYDNDGRYNIKTVLSSIRKVYIYIQIPIDRARSLKDNIGALLLFKPALYRSDTKYTIDNKGNSLIFETRDSSRATIDHPTSHFYERRYINVEALAIWIYDIRTGEILFKQPIKAKEQKEVEDFNK